MRLLSLTFLLCALTLTGLRAEQGQIEASSSLFSVLSALNAAGYDADLGSPHNSPLRALIGDDPFTFPLLDSFNTFRSGHMVVEER